MNLLLLSDLYSLKLSNADYWPLLGNKGKGTKKWHRILMIAEGKMSLSQVAESR